MIAVNTLKTESDLFGRSKWWGFPDMPEDLEYPEVPVNEDGELYYDPLTFICQIRCSDIAALDTKKQLPHEGMLYFFGALDYYLGNLDADADGIGEWNPLNFKVLYSPSCEDLHTHSILYDDGTPACLPAETIEFSKYVASADCSETRLLGKPFFNEVREAFPGMISLLQIDENDDWGLRFFDSGMLNFLISPEDLAARRFSAVHCYMHSL